MDWKRTLNGWIRRVPSWTIYVAGALYAAWVFWLALTGQTGPEPINTLERDYGEVALYLLVAGLAVTPVRRFLGINLIKHRRAIGVTCFFYVLAHFAVWALLDVRALAAVWADIVKRPYITVGMLALVMLTALGVTSNDLSIRKLGGATWRRIHQLVYPAAILAGLHYLWLSKGFQWKPTLFLAAILLLLATRIRWARLVETARKARVAS